MLLSEKILTFFFLHSVLREKSGIERNCSDREDDGGGGGRRNEKYGIKIHTRRESRKCTHNSRCGD